MFRVGSKLLLGLFYPADVNKGHHSTVDLVICGSVWPYPDRIPAAAVVFDFNLLGGNTVDYIANQGAHIGNRRVQINVDNEASYVGREEVEHLLRKRGESAYPEIVAQHEDWQVCAIQEVSYVIINLGQFDVPVL